MAAHTNHGTNDAPLLPPNTRQFSSLSPSIAGMDSAHGSVASDANSDRAIAPGAAAVPAGHNGEGTKEDEDDAGLATVMVSRSRRKKWFVLGALAFLVVAAAIAVPIGVVFGRKSNSGEGSGSGAGGSNGSGKGGTSGGDGSTVTTEDGSTFTYVNKFGGFWVDDPSDPFNNNAQANSWSPPLNTSWKWNEDKIYGVNIGGLFVLEPFIVPALFQKYQSSSIEAVDEWTLSQAMAADTSEGGGLGQLEDHYNTFITEEDIAKIAGAGLNWIRLPVPFWAIEVWNTSDDQEPFLARTCWKYILRVLRWARKYGLRVKFDLHTAPGSQNGYNHSGKFGQVNFLSGVMGYANAQRMLDYIRIFTEFISQPEYQSLVPLWGFINEPLVEAIGKDTIAHFYLQVHDMVRNVTGVGEGKGPFISMHDGFQGPAVWADFFPGADRLALDWHPYFAFSGSQNLNPVGDYAGMACNGWASVMSTSQTEFGFTFAGEFSNAINDCGLYVNGITDGHSYGGDCSFWQDATQWNQTVVDGLMNYALASMDALQNWFFWTWKIGNSTAGKVEAPLWSYQYGLENGFIPPDPRSASGVCSSMGVDTTFTGSYSAWQTGGASAGTIEAAIRESYTAWPPATMSGVDNMSFAPTYTATGTVSTLPPDTFTAAAKTVSNGDGWADASDTAKAITEVAGCSYPNPWDSGGVVLPTTTCAGTAQAARAVRRMLITPARLA